MDSTENRAEKIQSQLTKYLKPSQKFSQRILRKREFKNSNESVHEYPLNKNEFSNQQNKKIGY